MSALRLVYGMVDGPAGAKDEVVAQNLKVEVGDRDRPPRDLQEVLGGKPSLTTTSGRPIKSRRKGHDGTYPLLVGIPHNPPVRNLKYPISRLTSMRSVLTVATWTMDDRFKDTNKDHRCARWFNRRRSHSTLDSRSSVGNRLERSWLILQSLRNLNVAQTGSLFREKAKENLEVRTLS